MENSEGNDMIFTIDFSLLEYFKNQYNKTFKYIDLPYIIEKEYVEVTIPTGVKHLYHNENQVYVGSAEQSFIKYMSEGKLKENNYQSITICSRDEKILNNFSLLNFIKLELYSTEFSPMDLVNIVLEEYNNYDDRKYNIIKIEENFYDIYCNGIELGSFGIRFNPYTGTSFTFGTGLALPRFNSV